VLAERVDRKEVSSVLLALEAAILICDVEGETGQTWE